MAAGLPLSRQRGPNPAKPPTRAAAPPPNRGNLFRQQAPAASVDKVGRSAIHRPLVLPRLPDRRRPDPLLPAQRTQRAGPRPRSPRRLALSLLLLFEKASPTQKPCAYEHMRSRISATASMACSDPGCPVVLLEVQVHPDSNSQHRLAAQTYRQPSWRKTSFTAAV